MTEVARLIGLVSTEGGPLLIADRDASAGWTGTSGADYQRALDLLDVQPDPPARGIPLQDASGVLWDIPTGTTEVWRRGSAQLTMSRPWLDPDSDLSERLATVPRRSAVHLGDIEIRSGWLVILWAAEDARDLLAREPEEGISLNQSVGRSGLVVALPVGRYVISRDEVTVAAGSSRRCFVDPSVQDH